MLAGLLRPLLLALVAGIVWAAWQFDLPRHMSVAEMRALVDAHAPYGPLVFMVIVVAGLFTRVPMMGTVLVAMGAVLFGRLAAFAYGWLAALVGTTAILFLVRAVARDYVQRTLNARSERLRALDERITRHGFGTVLVLRLVLALHRCSIGGSASLASGCRAILPPRRSASFRTSRLQSSWRTPL
jgi:uncharacterized membrane protein YdjX (TVP38/TMEM64 family)